MKVGYEKLIEDSIILSKKIPQGKYEAVYGIPSGGILPAYIISQELGVPFITKEQIEGEVLIVDDLVDSGETVKEFLVPDGTNHSRPYDVAVLYRKEYAPEVTYFVEDVGTEWVKLPHESGNRQEVEHHIRRLVEYIGENPNREGLANTPKRVIKSYGELFSGYGKKIEDVLTVFANEGYNQMVMLKDIEFYSTCEHHMLPFFGKAHIAYIPNEKIVGLSKLARVVEIFSRRLQNQERLTNQIAESLQKTLNAKGVAVVMEGEHFCMKARGVNKQNSVMKTASLTGAFQDNLATREEFYNLIK